jgi:hypothetical protein
LAIKANKFNSDTLKNAITINMKKINTAKKTHIHFAHELLKAENVHKENTAPIDKIIS